MDLITSWTNYFNQNKIEKEQQQLLLNYLSNLFQNNLPIIFELDHLAMLIGIDKHQLFVFINNSESAYRSFSIPKRSGGSREILSPYPMLAYCQRWILDNILNSVPLHKRTFAFRQNYSIKDNAILHLNQDELLKIDIKDFFSSIKINRVISLFYRLGYTYSLSVYLAAICCYRGYLPQGASTSPMLSNIIAGVLDIRLLALAEKFELNYSRYADDITFSGKKIPKKFVYYCYSILQEEGFEPNKKKTFYKQAKKRKIVTGICVTGDRVRIPKSYRRKFRQEIYFLKKNGIKEYNGEIGKVDPLYIYRMIGKAYFILNIEPDNKFIKDTLIWLKKML